VDLHGRTGTDSASSGGRRAGGTIMAYQRTTEQGERADQAAPPTQRVVTNSEETYTTASDPYEDRRNAAWRLGQLVYLIFGVVIALIAIRFVLLLLGANPNAGFTDFVYDVTGPLVAPFEGIFGAPDIESGVFDPASLVAIVVYSLIAWVVAKVIGISLGETRTGVRSNSRSVDTRMR
jgi:uncharacterized protein YggT (Ycf19 family)